MPSIAPRRRRPSRSHREHRKNNPLPPRSSSRYPKTPRRGGPIGLRVLVTKDEDKKQTKAGIHLPDKIEIPTLTGRIVAISAKVAADTDRRVAVATYPIKRYDRILFNPKHAVPVDFEGDNRLFVIPVEDVVAVFRKDGDEA